MAIANKEAIKLWARFACSASEADSQRWENIQKKLSKEDLAAVLAYLAGYLVATCKLEIEKLAC